MWSIKRTVLAAGGGALAAAALFAGAVMAQSPGETTPTPAPGGSQPGVQQDRDCPKDGASGSTTGASSQRPARGGNRGAASQF
jgi:hypothetical protein